MKKKTEAYPLGMIVIITWPIPWCGTLAVSGGIVSTLNEYSKGNNPGWEIVDEKTLIHKLYIREQEKEIWHPYDWIMPFRDPDNDDVQYFDNSIFKRQEHWEDEDWWVDEDEDEDNWI